VKKYKYFLLSAGDAFYEPPNGDTPDAAVDVSMARRLSEGGTRHEAFLIQVSGSALAAYSHGDWWDAVALQGLNIGSPCGCDFSRDGNG